MSFLDLYQADQREAMRPQPNEGHDLPATFGESFHAAWDYGRLFEQSTAHENARMEALQDYLGSIRDKTGTDVSPQMDWTVDAPGVGSTPNGSSALLGQANAALGKIKASRPDLQFDPLDDAGLDNAALDKSRAAGKALGDITGREHSGLGLFAGSTAAAATDRINILALPVAPETAGVSLVGAALRWGSVAALSQIGIEAAGDNYREQVQPGYSASGAPLANVAEAFGGGAVLGGVTRALGNAWTRVKTGAWPTSIKDAGNLLESEAHVADHNVYDGAAGEAAHRDAMATSVDQVLKGEPVDVSKIITPEIEATARDARSPAEMDLLHGYTRYGDEDQAFEFKPLSQIDDEARYDGGGGVYGNYTYLDPTGRWIKGEEGALGHNQAVRARANFKNLFTLSPETVERYKSIVGDAAANGPEAARVLEEKGYDGLQVKGFDEHSTPNGIDTNGLQDQVVSFAPDSNLTITKRNILRKLDSPFFENKDETAAYWEERHRAVDAEVGSFVQHSRREPSRPADVPSFEGTEKPTVIPPEQLRATVESADHASALQADIDRERVADVNRGILVDMDKDGNPVFRSLDSMADEAEAYRKVADQIAACASPVTEETP